MKNYFIAMYSTKGESSKVNSNYVVCYEESLSEAKRSALLYIEELGNKELLDIQPYDTETSAFTAFCNWLLFEGQ